MVNHNETLNQEVIKKYGISLEQILEQSIHPENVVMELLSTSHFWGLDDEAEENSIDFFAFDSSLSGYMAHNGPVCSYCHYSICIHCLTAGLKMLNPNCPTD